MEFPGYVCPKCRGALREIPDGLACEACGASYPIQEGIPDFLEGNPGTADGSLRRTTAIMDLLAPWYETRIWYPVFLRVVGGTGAPRLREIVRRIHGIARVERGRILDVACGPGTMGRGLASPDRVVFGIDASLGMLRRGIRIARREGIGNLRFARGRAEALPFADGTFDAALCGGALHLFPDPEAALREIARVLRPGAPLAGMTILAGPRGILSWPRIRAHAQREHGLRPFEEDALPRIVRGAGFEDFTPTTFGSLVLFGAWRVGGPQ